MSQEHTIPTTTAGLRTEVICELQQAGALVARATASVVDGDDRAARRYLAGAVALLVGASSTVSLLGFLGPDV